MNTLRLYLWKEWREHRVALLAGWLVFVAAMAGDWYLFPSKFFGDPLFRAVACVAALIVTLLAVGGELLAERRAGGLSWLERLPSGLETAFGAKLVFHCATCVAAASLGLAIALGVMRLRGFELERFDWPSEDVLLLGGAFALWTFAASSWSSRSVISLFSAGFILVGLAAPTWYLARSGYRWTAGEFSLGCVLLFGGSIPAAWAGFVSGGRFGRGPTSSALRGLSVAAACAAPFWTWCSFQLHERDRIDLDAPGFSIQQAHVTGDAQTAFVAVMNWSPRWAAQAIPSFVLRVDLGDGSWRQIGAPFSNAIPFRPCRESGSSSSRVLQVASPLSAEPASFFDLETGAELALENLDGLLPAWRCRNTHGWIPHRAPFSQERIHADPLSAEEVPLASLALPMDAIVWTDFDLCLVHSGTTGWSRLEPKSGELRRCPWLARVEELGPRLPDGRFFATLEQGVGLVDPAAEQVIPVRADHHFKWISKACGEGSMPFAEDELVLLKLGGGEIYRFDQGTMSLEPITALRDMVPVRATRDGLVFCRKGRHLLRVDIASGATTTLFPRDH